MVLKFCDFAPGNSQLNTRVNRISIWINAFSINITVVSWAPQMLQFVENGDYQS